jgi:hypothetical protein
MASYSNRQIDLGVRGLSIRSVYQPLMALQGIGVPIDTNNRLFNALRTVIITNYSILMLQGAYRTFVAAKQAREIAIAASETAAMAAAQQWVNIGLAAGAAVLVGASLAIGYTVGEKFGSGDWNLPSRNISNPQDRRMMESDLRATGVGRRG